MKGKGKGGAGGNSSSNGRGHTHEEKEVGLQFPDFKPVDHKKQCPRYSAVLQRSDEDGIGIEEIDILQSELETLIASVAKRMRMIEGEEDRHKVANKVDSVSSPSTTSSVGQKRSSGKDDKPMKRHKEMPGKGQSTPGRGKGKVQSLRDREHNGSESPHPKELPRHMTNDIPNKFWSTVEPYCAEITNEDLKVLEDILKSHEDDADYQKVPNLGKHYSKKWAQEDMLDEQKDSSKIMDKKTPSIPVKDDKLENAKAAEAQQVEAMLKRAEEINDYGSPFLPLTQRLVCALIEENIMSPMGEPNIQESDLNAAEAVSMSPRMLAKQLNITNAQSFEKRIRRELELQGIFEEEPLPDDDPNEEILVELRKKQQELRQLSSHNLQVVKRLVKAAKEEMQRQDIRHKIVVADAEVMEAYRKIQASRSKKKSASKSEYHATWRAIKEREALIKSLECV